MTLENIEADVIPSHLLVELTSLDGLSFPTSSSKRIKFTCINASPRYLVLGTTTGTIYVFSRYRQKRANVSNSALPPVDVVLIKDGPINTIVVSPNEQFIGIGSDSGRVSVVSLVGNEQTSSVMYSIPGDARKPDKVGAMCWTRDSKALIAGHHSGLVNLHRLDTRSVFRSSHEALCMLSGEVFQIDINNGNLLLLSTPISSHIYDLENGKLIQVGKKPRNAKMGACFLQSNDPTQTCGEYVVASRPNGRIWECNTVGVVYRTHQFRLSTKIPRFSVISFRTIFEGQQKEDENSILESAINMDVNFGLLHRINSDSKSLALTCNGSKFIVVDPDTSQAVLMTDIHEDVLGISVCGSDLFVLLSGATFLKKFSLMSITKAAEKLKIRGSFAQAAQLVLNTSQIPVYDKLLVNEIIEGLSKIGKKNELEHKLLRQQLCKELERLNSLSAYDNLSLNTEKAECSSRLPSGVHRVHSTTVQDDHFAMVLPSLRERSLSSPNFEQEHLSGILHKRASIPLTNEEVQLSQGDVKNSIRAEILTKARELLSTNGQISEVESLRVLLQLDNADNTDILRFVPTVTTANVALTLAELSVSPRVDLPRVSVERKVSTGKIKRSGPTIVKPIRLQQGKKGIVAKKSIIHKVPTCQFDAAVAVEPNSNCVLANDDDISTDMSCNDHENNEVEILEGEWLNKRLQVLTAQENETPIIEGDFEKEAASTLNMERQEGSYCPDCGIHRSWVAVSLLALVCRRVNVEKDLFSIGAVPNTDALWIKLFQKRFKKIKGVICPKCEVCVASSKKLSFYGDITSSSVRQKSSAEKLRERIVTGDENRLRKILFTPIAKCPLIDPQNLTKDDLPDYLDKINMEDEIDSRFNWISNVDIESLMSICCIVLGVGGYLKIVKQLPILKSAMDDSCWSLLVSLLIRENAMRDKIIHHQALNELISNLGLEGILSLEIPTDPSLKKRALYRQVPPPIFSWIVDCKSVCPICTLPLHMEGNTPDIAIFSFNCGHSYHTPCVSGKSFCIACQIRARRNAAQARSSKS